MTNFSSSVILLVFVTFKYDIFKIMPVDIVVQFLNFNLIHRLFNQRSLAKFSSYYF